ncbi:hypothetical protein Fcan01_23089 [Folsomia candida]|uniref:Uncharacterized protein n=1 Tax=Folsomia candida TaxID=158441 RepID=A0A226DAH3_FOLCA|nr:hypothetical protein Fcan01_23089 [Folsomia candida]
MKFVILLGAMVVLAYGTPGYPRNAAKALNNSADPSPKSSAGKIFLNINNGENRYGCGGYTDDECRYECYLIGQRIIMLIVISLGAVLAMACGSAVHPHNATKAFNNPADPPPTSSARDIFLNMNNGKQISWCGDFPDDKCRDTCYCMGYSCFQCSSTSCICSNDC